MEGKSVVPDIDIKTGQPSVQSKIGRIEVEKSTEETIKIGKVLDIGLTREMLTCGGDAVVKWMLWIYKCKPKYQAGCLKIGGSM